jgi:hypothetical protein
MCNKIITSNLLHLQYCCYDLEERHLASLEGRWYCLYITSYINTYAKILIINVHVQ